MIHGEWVSCKEIAGVMPIPVTEAPATAIAVLTEVFNMPHIKLTDITVIPI